MADTQKISKVMEYAAYTSFILLHTIKVVGYGMRAFDRMDNLI